MVKPQKDMDSNNKRKRDFSAPKTKGEYPKKSQNNMNSNKRKRDFSAPKTKGEYPKKSQKLQSNNTPQKGFKKTVKFNKDKPSKPHGAKPRIKPGDKKQERKKTKEESLEWELTKSWEKMRRKDITQDERSKLVTEALIKMKGTFKEILNSPVFSRVFQTCLKYCSKDERNAVFEEIRPLMITLVTVSYGAHVVMKMLDHASKEQLASFISSLHGQVAYMLRHPVASLVIDHAYSMGSAKQKQSLLMELYSPELRLFKDLASISETRVIDIISKLQLQKSSVLHHMSTVLQPILEKGILYHSITHKVIAEYLTIVDKTHAAELIEQLSDANLAQMIHTKDGSNVVILCIKHGSAKERKKIIKGLKGHVQKAARDRYGCMVLISLLSSVDDTKILSQIITRELVEILNEVVLDQHARRPLLQLLHPNCSRYFHPDDLISLNSSIPSLTIKGSGTDSSEESNSKCTAEDTAEPNTSENDDMSFAKKDPLIRRKELLIKNGLAEKLVKVCIDLAEDLLRSKFGKEVIYEVITGGADDILHPDMDEKLGELYEKIAHLVAEPKSSVELNRHLLESVDGEVNHLLEDFHSSRTIRHLILNCPAFASKLWEIGLKGKCAQWAEGHSSKVICAFLETPDMDSQKSAKKELQPLIDSGVLKLPAKDDSAKEV